MSGQVKEIKRLVVANQDTLLALHTNRDKTEIFHEVLRKLRSESSGMQPFFWKKKLLFLSGEEKTVQ